MANAEQFNHAGAFLTRAKEYPASAEDNLAAQRCTPAPGDAFHAGISAKDDMLTELAGATRKSKWLRCQQLSAFNTASSRLRRLGLDSWLASAATAPTNSSSSSSAAERTAP